MKDFDKKIVEHFDALCLRKSLTNEIKTKTSLPTYVVEFLIGTYCNFSNEVDVADGIRRIGEILTENVATPSKSELIKSKICENKEYKIIDKIRCIYAEKYNKYYLKFTNLRLESKIEVSPDIVFKCEKLLTEGLWALVTLYFDPFKTEEEEVMEIADEDENYYYRKKKKPVRQRFLNPFSVSRIKPIQLPYLDCHSITSKRAYFEKDEWISLILRSIGYEPDNFTDRQKMHLLLRVVPLIQKNYNILELGPRGTGKSHVYGQISPYSHLISGGNIAPSVLFYNIRTKSPGLLSYWDCVAFDEVGGLEGFDPETLQILKNYMANSNYSRGSFSGTGECSLSFEGNTFRGVHEMLKDSNLLEPFPKKVREDTAFFDRFHAYLPGWEVPKLSGKHFTSDISLITDVIALFFKEMREKDFSDICKQYFELNENCNVRDSTAIYKTFSGLAKLIYSDRKMSKEDIRELLEYAIEYRRRIKEQLRRIQPIEFAAVELGYIDLETNNEYIVDLLEEPKESILSNKFELPGVTYSVGLSESSKIGVYKIESNKMPGTGKLHQKNIEITGDKRTIYGGLYSAFSFFKEKCFSLTSANAEDYDFRIFINDFKNSGISDEVSLGCAISFVSTIMRKPVTPGLIVVGRIVMSGSMVPSKCDIVDLVSIANTTGASKILLPLETKQKFENMPQLIRNKLEAIYYVDAMDAIHKALNMR